MHGKGKVFCSSGSLGPRSSDPSCTSAPPAGCHPTHIAPQAPAEPKLPGQAGGRLSWAPSGSHTLPLPADSGVKLGRMSSEGRGGGGGKNPKQTTKATQECVIARLSSAAIRARQIPEQCLRKQRGGLSGLPLTTLCLPAGGRGWQHPAQPGLPAGRRAPRRWPGRWTHGGGGAPRARPPRGKGR